MLALTSADMLLPDEITEILTLELRKQHFSLKNVNNGYYGVKKERRYILLPLCFPKKAFEKLDILK